MGGLLLEGGIMGLSISSSGTSLSLISSDCTDGTFAQKNINAIQALFYDFSSHFIHKRKYFLII